MRIVHLSTHDITGGAARSAYRLHTGLRQLGCDSLMFVAHRKSEDDSVVAFRPPRDLLSRLSRRLRQAKIQRSFALYQNTRPAGYEGFSDARSQYGASFLKQLPSHNLVNLHWIAGFVDYKTFFTIVPQRTPIVWRLSDQNAFTGGCHYDDGCGKYNTGCGKCPQLGSGEEEDLSAQLWQCKKELFSRISAAHLHIVAQSRWMADQTRNSALLGRFPVTIIPNGLDTTVFSPQNRARVRDAFGIPRAAKVVLFAAASITNRRKGFAFLARTLAKLRHTDLFLVSLGKGTPSFDLYVPHLHLDKIEDDHTLAQVYSAADVYVIPSLQDTLPNTVLEAMACGTPIVGFAIGGIPDMVRPDLTGLLVPVGNVDALRDAISQLLENEAKKAEMSVNCRLIAMKEYSLELQVRRYIALYEELLSQSQGSLLSAKESGWYQGMPSSQ